MTPSWRITETKPVSVGRRGRRFLPCFLAIARSAAEPCKWLGACGPQVSTLAMYALLPVLVLMEQKFLPKKIEESQSKFTCDALLKCHCLRPAKAATSAVAGAEA